VHPSTPDPAVRVVSVRGKGRAVLAARPVPAGEVIERAPVIVIPAADWDVVSATAVGRYCFCWRDRAGDTAIALGYGSLLNHSYAPNAYTRRSIRQRAMEFIALRDIAEGEEITLNYNGDPDGRAAVGFRVLAPVSRQPARRDPAG
jgi:SET domain-containing protein